MRVGERFVYKPRASKSHDGSLVSVSFIEYLSEYGIVEGETYTVMSIDASTSQFFIHANGNTISFAIGWAMEGNYYGQLFFNEFDGRLQKIIGD